MVALLGSARRAAAGHREHRSTATSTCAATRSPSPARPADNAIAVRLFEELLELIKSGQHLTPDAVDARPRHPHRRHRRAPGRGAEPEHPVAARQEHPSEDAEPEALRRRDRQAHHRVRHRPGRYRQDLPRGGQGRAGAAGQAGQPHHPDPAGGRGRRAARLPARHAVRQDRPVPAAAARRAARHARPRVDAAADAGRHDRDRAAGLHARPHAQRRVHHPGRGAEHHARADEDVPDPARLRLARSSSPATSPRSTCPATPAQRAAGRARHPRRRRRRALRQPDVAPTSSGTAWSARSSTPTSATTRATARGRRRRTGQSRRHADAGRRR